MIPLLLATASLGGCNFVVMAPSGDVALQQRDLVIVSTILMLLIIVPVMALTVYFAWRYRQSNAKATYKPDWDHSTQLELVIWAAPLLIVICLGALTWMGTHLLDPYRQIGRIDAKRGIDAASKPLEVDVVALDWKWLFIYPEYGVASVNELAAPIDRQIDFHITASTVMNSFYIPALAGQIYAMPGMETRLHAVINEKGVYRGFSANYSGAGFSHMRFNFHGLDQAGFEAWIAKAKAAPKSLDQNAYLELERPTENVPPIQYASVSQDLYRKVLNLCVQPGKMCESEMMAIDARGGLGLEGARNVLPLEYDKHERRGAVLGALPSYVASICTTTDPQGVIGVVRVSPDSDANSRQSRTPASGPVVGSGLPSPTFAPQRKPTLTEVFGPHVPLNS
jgi:cytochrome o ubiquinol oxidase subunit 2